MLLSAVAVFGFLTGACEACEAGLSSSWEVRLGTRTTRRAMEALIEKV